MSRLYWDPCWHEHAGKKTLCNAISGNSSRDGRSVVIVWGNSEDDAGEASVSVEDDEAILFVYADVSMASAFGEGSVAVLSTFSLPLPALHSDVSTYVYTINAKQDSPCKMFLISMKFWRKVDRW
jgi:hypothetical protein